MPDLSSGFPIFSLPNFPKMCGH